MKKDTAQLGDMVEVKWLDACLHANTQLSKAKLAEAVNRGVLVRRNRKELTLMSGVYPPVEDGDPFGDHFVVPAGWCTEIKVLIKGDGGNGKAKK